MTGESVCFLLGVWGESYIQNFFDFSLRSLLAPGNIPAMSEEFHCTFLFLTQTKDIRYFKQHPTFSLLATYCKIEFVDISDLIFDGNYTATLTLAYDRGMRSKGDRMCHTYFFCLVSDYIIANGSFHNLKPYLKKGYSGITTGNFLVVEEYVSDSLKSIRDANDGIISMSPREMFTFALPYIHPVSTGQTITQNFIHATHANRLFWKVNDHLIVGRFYLRHMLVVKPETKNYVIGSSCDYSFIPEMCPSGNVAHIQDSDEYFLIEMSPFHYERQFIKLGPPDKKKLATHFSQWTTKEHRTNAYLPVIFHSKDLDNQHLEAVKISEQFVKELEHNFTLEPQPVRGHFYWTACIESLCHFYLKKQDTQKLGFLYQNIFENKTFSAVFHQPDDRFFLKITHPPASVPLSEKQKKKQNLKKKWAGSALDSRLFHLHWFDDLQLKTTLEQHDTPFIVIAFEPIPNLVHWFEENYPTQCHFQFYDLMMRRSPKQLEQIFQHCMRVLIISTQDHGHELTAAIRQCSTYLPPESSICVYIKQKPTPSRSFKEQIAIALADVAHKKIECQSAHYYCSHARKNWETQYNQSLEHAFAPGKKFRTRIKGFTGLSFLNFKCLLLNSVNRIKKSSKRKINCALIHLVVKKVS